MQVKNLGNLLNELKPFLRRYLEDYGTHFSEQHFQCPNRKFHSNNDEEPACNFYPDDNHFKCFVCGETGDIFNACNLLEGRPVSGKGFINDNVLYLANKYKIKYTLGQETEREKDIKHVRQFLETLIKSGNTYLKKYKPQTAADYIEKRNWSSIIDSHMLGYLPDDPKVKKLFDDFRQQHPNLISENRQDASAIVHISYRQITNRLIFPVYNAYGMIVAITSRRVVDQKHIPKYKHHVMRKEEKQTVNILYNLNQARKFSRLYVVEGASSVFTLAANGIESVVAVMGSNFNEKHYKWLLKNDVKEIVFCFDGDEPGKEALKKAIHVIESLSGIRVFVKVLRDGKDPDDILQTEGLDAFLDIQEISSFKHQLKQYCSIEDEESAKEYRDSLFAMLLASSDAVIRERMIEMIVKDAKILKSVVVEELGKYEKRNDLIEGISTAEYLEEGELLAKEVDSFDELRWRTGKLIGFESGFKLYDEAMDGVRIGLHLVGGKWNVGKSAFCASLALGLAQNENNYILYESLDDPSIHKTIPRFIASMSGVDVNLIMKPRFGIEKNETLTEDEKTDMLQNVENAINMLKHWGSRFSLKDTKYGQSLDDLTKHIKICKQRALDLGNKNLIVFIDFLHMIETKDKEENDKLIKVAKQLKEFSTLYEVPIIATVMGTKAEMQSKSSGDVAIKGAVELQYQADAIYMLSTDFHDKKGKMYFYDDNGTSRPIISCEVTKNKLSGFKGKIFYRYFGELLTYTECDDEEQRKFRKSAT